MSKYHERRVASNPNAFKKIAIDFGLTPQKELRDAFGRGTQLNSSQRYIRGNITWRKHPLFGRNTIAQIAFASSDEPKVMRIMNKFGGKIVPLKEDSVQNGIEETNLSGTTYNFEQVNEYINIKEEDVIAWA